MMLFNREKNELTEVKVNGIPIGLSTETRFLDKSLDLVSGDRLVLYTDGVPDIFNPDGELFGKVRLMDMIKLTQNLPADEALLQILDELQKWSEKDSSESYDDDITLIMIDVSA